jgi:hypothetical protein
VFSPKCDLQKPGIKRLNQVGGFAVIANKKLHDHGKSQRFAVVNTSEQWVDSVHTDYKKALAHTQKLI